MLVFCLVSLPLKTVENHTGQELEVEWKGIDRIKEQPELGGINKDYPVQLMPLHLGLLWNNLGNNLTPFGLKHQQISTQNLALGEGEIKTGSSHHFPFLTGGNKRIPDFSKFLSLFPSDAVAKLRSPHH